jgi:retron-type reverse transcriptase
MHLYALLNDQQKYRDQIDRLHLKYSLGNRLYELEQDGVSLASICLKREKVARLLARTVARGKYILRPMQACMIKVGGKQRLIYLPCLTDRIVHGVIAAIIEAYMRPHLSPALYSYRKGTHRWKALGDVARYTRAHRRSHPNPKTRGLYVLRGDVHAYTDSIPVHSQSRLWPMLQEMISLNVQRKRSHRQYWELIQAVIRPEIFSTTGILYSNILGIPTGSPISTVLFNLYLTPMDHELHNIPGAFYARYCDDFLFCHPDPSVARRVSERIDEILAQYDLHTNRQKDQTFYFNGAGRPSLQWPEAKGTTHISFLGCTLSFEGTVALKHDKLRELRKDLVLRAQRTLRALNDRRPEVAGPVICRVLNQALNPTALGHHKTAPVLRHAVTCRRQLKQIDYDVARLVASVLTGRTGPQAFRRVSYHTIRSQWKLVSLFHTRNVSARTRSAPIRSQAAKHLTPVNSKKPLRGNGLSRLVRSLTRQAKIGTAHPAE